MKSGHLSLFISLLSASYVARLSTMCTELFSDSCLHAVQRAGKTQKIGGGRPPSKTESTRSAVGARNVRRAWCRRPAPTPRWHSLCTCRAGCLHPVCHVAAGVMHREGHVDTHPAPVCESATRSRTPVFRGTLLFPVHQSHSRHGGGCLLDKFPWIPPRYAWISGHDTPGPEPSWIAHIGCHETLRCFDLSRKPRNH